MKHFIQNLRESKLEIKERLKMLRYYGMMQSPLAMLKILCSGFSTHDNIQPFSQNNGEYHDENIPNELRSHLRKIKDLNKSNDQIFSNPPTITFISYSIPRLDSTSSQFRLCNIIKILLGNCCKINFLYCTELWNDAKHIKIFDGDINFTHLSWNRDEYARFIADKNPQYVWVTELWRINYVKFITELIGELKISCPASRLIVDTIDFHYKEFQRKYEMTGDSQDLKLANEFLEKEKVLYQIADTVVVISEEEKNDIQDNIKDIKKIKVVPNIHKIPYNTRPYSKRKNICFVGHFGNKHNVDAVTHFLENIFQGILEKNPDVEFHILGYSANKYKKRFESSNVKVIGGLKYLEDALTYYRLFVCPMTYGAGMKGKIGGAIAAGVPVVTTTIGAEGFPLRDDKECFIADSPTEFSKKCNQCLGDPNLWYNFSVKARLMVAENFSPNVVSKKIKKVFNQI